MEKNYRRPSQRIPDARLEEETTTSYSSSRTASWEPTAEQGLRVQQAQVSGETQRKKLSSEKPQLFQWE